MTKAIICLFSFLALCCSGAQQLPPAPQAHLTDITTSAGFFNEPAIAVNPKNPRQLVVAWQINASAAYSDNGGRTWTIASGTAPKDYRVSGDVSLAYDGSGNAFLCYIAFDKLGSTNYWAQGATRNGIFVRRSPDGGKTWEPNAVPVIAHESTPNIPFEDKSWIVAATSGPHSGDLYVGWTQFTLAASDMLFSRSTDSGKTWSAPIRLNSVSGLPRDDNGDLEGFHGVVGPDGTLYTVWDDRDGIMMAISHDGGRTFSKDQRIIPAGPAYFGIAGVSRSNGFSQIGIDPRSGRLYVAWSDYINGDVDVFVSSSGDHGQTWSSPVRVNNDPLHNGADQFFQWMAVDPVTGAVNLIFYDRREINAGRENNARRGNSNRSEDNRLATVTLARSVDEGRSFANYTFDPQSFEPEGDFLGDYLALTAWDGKVFGAWAHQVSLETKDTKETREARVEHGKQTRTILRTGVADFNR
jgi:hypothetical protein